MSDETNNGNDIPRRGPGRPPNPRPDNGAPVGNRAPIHSTSTASAHEPDHEPVHDKARVRTRQRSATAQDNPFDIPLGEIPEGSSYEWKRYSISGQSADHDPFYLASMRRQGWEPVDPKRHPNWVPPGYDKPNIIRDGLILMERPKELTDEARAEVRALSKQQMREAEQRLGLTPKDTMTRDFRGVEPRIDKQIGRMVAIEE
jgi:hypothetical protein